MNRSLPKYNRGLVIQLPLWDDVKAHFVRYRGRFSLKTIKQVKREQQHRLKEAISNQWQSAEELAQEADLTYHCAVKLLTPLINAGDVIVKSETWIDTRFRKRERWVYRKAPTGNAGMFSLLGQAQVPDFSRCSTAVRVHRCEDD